MSPEYERSETTLEAETAQTIPEYISRFHYVD
jgi:hypothetical protein